MNAPKPKKRRWWRWAGLAAAGLVAVYLSAYFYGRWIPHNKATTHITAPVTADGRIDYIAAIEAELSKGVTPQNNAAVLLVQIIEPREGDDSIEARLAAAGASDQRRDVKPLVGFESVVPDVVPGEGWKLKSGVFERVELAMARPWTAAEHPDLAGVLASNEKVLALVEEASRRTHVDLPRGKGELEGDQLMGGYLPWYPKKIHTVSDQLRVRAMLRAKDDPRLAVADAMTLLRLGQLLARHPHPVFVNTGGGLLRQGELLLANLLPHLPDDVVADLRQQVAQLPAFPAMTDQLDTTQRWLELWNFQDLARRPTSLARLTCSCAPTYQQFVVRLAPVLPIQFGRGMRKINAEFDRAVALSRLTTFAALSAATKATVSTNHSHGSFLKDLISGEFLPVHGSQWSTKFLREYHFNRLAHRNALMVAVEVEAYKRKHGTYPDSLDSVGVPLPADPITAKPILYERTNDGFELRLVGADMKDDRTYAKGDRIEYEHRDVVWQVPPPVPEAAEEEDGT